MEDVYEKVTSPKFTQQRPPPIHPSRVGALDLMRDPVELLGRCLKERRDVETGQARRGEQRGKRCLCVCVCRCGSGFCLCYWSSFWKVKHPGRTAIVTVWKMLVKVIFS